MDDEEHTMESESNEHIQAENHLSKSEPRGGIAKSAITTPHYTFHLALVSLILSRAIIPWLFEGILAAASSVKAFNCG